MSCFGKVEYKWFLLGFWSMLCSAFYRLEFTVVSDGYVRVWNFFSENNYIFSEKRTFCESIWMYFKLKYCDRSIHFLMSLSKGAGKASQKSGNRGRETESNLRKLHSRRVMTFKEPGPASTVYSPPYLVLLPGGHCTHGGGESSIIPLLLLPPRRFITSWMSSSVDLRFLSPIPVWPITKANVGLCRSFCLF